MMNEWKADSLVKLSSEHTTSFRKSFLRQAVCEFRFPTLMELGDPKPPPSFVNALRKEYPHLEMMTEYVVGPADSASGLNAHVLRSNKLNWSVTLRQSALSIETTSYSGFEELKKRILQVVMASKGVLDTDFFTRIGLRYINIINVDADPVHGWINPELTRPLRTNKFTGVSEFSGKLGLKAEDGGCLLQHGLTLTKTRSDAVKPSYTIDIDAYREDVQFDRVEAALDVLHAQAFDIFDWALDVNAHNFLKGQQSTARD